MHVLLTLCVFEVHTVLELYTGGINDGQQGDKVDEPRRSRVGLWKIWVLCSCMRKEKKNAQASGGGDSKFLFE